MRPGIRETFVSRGVRCTPQRERIYSALRETDTHPTADELFRVVRTEIPGISLATIYNALETFIRAGLVRRIAPSAGRGADHHGAFRYDADTTHHAHVITAAGDVIDLPEDISREVLDSIPDQVRERIEREMGVKIARISVEFVENASPPTADDPV